MGYKRKKTGTKKEQKIRYTSTGQPEVYYVDVDVFETVYESDTSSTGSSYDTTSGYSSDPGGYSSGSDY